MANLLCYRKDWKENALAWKRRCSQRDADKIVRKLRRHFDVFMYKSYLQRDIGAEFSKRSNGDANPLSFRIRLPKENISLGLIAHEIAHLVCFKRYKSSGHRKPFMRALKVVNNYIRRKNYFDNEVQWKGKHPPRLVREFGDWGFRIGIEPSLERFCETTLSFKNGGRGPTFTSPFSFEEIMAVPMSRMSDS